MNTDKIYAESIAKEYAPKSNSKLVALKKLDKKAKLPSTVFAYIFGIFGTLVLGTGMCLCMGVIGGGTAAFMAAGIASGVVGMAVMAINYPIYTRLREKGKSKYAFEIVELARQISEEE